jgi:F0F1-type ATP synthase assembly protein I
VTSAQALYNAPAFGQQRLPNVGVAPAPINMNNIFGVRYRLVLRVVLLQMGCATFAGLLFWMTGGAAAAVAAFTGGMIVAVGTAVFGWRMFAPGIAPASRLFRAMVAAESLKWIWLVVAIWAALARFELRALPLLTGLVIAQFGYWIGMVTLKRGN